MMASTRQCHSTCPPGYSVTTWPSQSTLMGRVCTERSMLALVSGRDVTIIAGSAVGGAVCVGVVIGALLYMRRRTKPSPDHHHQQHQQHGHQNHHHHHRYPLPRLWRDKRPNTTEKPVAVEERAEFLEQLASLRGEAANFLEMLNHTRNRFRTLGGPDSPTDTKTKAYRAVVRDLSRVLTLLNRREEHILTVPGDWRRLLSWAVRVLARYKRQKAAKESGALPSPDPLHNGGGVGGTGGGTGGGGGGGTLYQTRKQAQAERCRLVQVTQASVPSTTQTTQSSSTTTTTSSSSSTGTSLTSSPSFSDADSRSFHQSLEDSFEDLSRSHMGSRTVSLMSLTPIIFEEDDDEILYEDHLPTPPSDDSPRSSFDHHHQYTTTTNNNSKEVLFDDRKSTKKSKSNKIGKEYDEFPRSGYHVENEDELFVGESQIVTEKNNNNITSKFHFNKGKGDPFRSSLSIREQIMNLRNIEHLLEARNVDKYITPDLNSSYVKEESTANKNEEKAKTQTPLGIPHLEENNNDNKGLQTSIVTPKTKENIIENLGTLTPPPVDPLKGRTECKQTTDNDPINTTFSGSDVYTSVIRKPVALPSFIMLAGDPYRDDTIDSGSESMGYSKEKTHKMMKARQQQQSTSPGVVSVHCNREARRRRQLHQRTTMAPRIELTTEL
ncbi:hypothetical protein Pmani_023370 [Petrolisthes manimaculis]|uniref:Uncharacterized protein n=1 Tax=Petrolisthes manimaculis TaxID=1843537 RepID=A0AAE1U3F2_9EUCA|nr:hypothetical protein Pmani_023370 [Petrolisthes manimaculis]